MPDHVRNHSAYASKDEAELARSALIRYDLPITQAAHRMGLSRPHLSRMLNGDAPMVKSHLLALKWLLFEKRQHRKGVDQ